MEKRDCRPAFGTPLNVLTRPRVSASLVCSNRRVSRTTMVLNDVAPSSLRVLVVGSGGREHALVDAVSRSEYVSDVIAVPGNVGMENLCRRVPEIQADDIDAIVGLAKEERAGLVVVGPEVPLVGGIVDRLAEEGILAFGPSADAAILEGSKGFTKDFLARHNIPTAWYGRFTDADAAKGFIREKGVPIVVKADGLAAGKGVIIAQTVDEACEAVDNILVDGAFGEAGREIIVEEFLDGEEVSFFALIDGNTAVPLASAQDHKPAYDGDKGPNTGGMGAYSPAPICDDALQQEIMDLVVLPTMRGMADEGRTFRGVLYCGMMVDKKTGHAKVLECTFCYPRSVSDVDI
jgi:phosphoribosylamine---glycine ligase